MWKSRLSLLSLAALLALLVSCSRPADLQQGHSLPSDPQLVQLTGPWMLYENELCPAADCSGPAREDAPLLLTEENPPRYGTYVMHLQLPAVWQNQSLALQVMDVGTAYSIYVDGEHRGGRGQESAEASGEIPDSLPAVFQFRSGEELTITVTFSNYSHPRGGLRKPLLLGPSSMVQDFRERSILRNVLSLGVILGMAFYHFGLFLNRRSDRASLLFGLVCLSWSIRMLFTDEVMIRTIGPLDYGLQTAIEYLSFILAGPLFLAFLSATFPVKGSQWLARINLSLAGLAFLFILVTPVLIYADYLWVFHLLILVSVFSSIYIWTLSVIERKSGAIPSLLGGLIACLMAVNDVLFYRGESPVGPLFHYGLLMFILAQSYLLARMFALAYEAVRKLSENLKNTNASLARFVPSELLRMLGRSDITQVNLGDQVQESMTVMFTDIRSFTTLSERMSPAENFNFLNSYLRRMTPLVNSQGGFVDKYIGDAVMALFPGKPDDGLRAAIEMQKEIRVYNRHRALKGYEPISIGVGVHTGDIMLGIIGHENRMEGTVISDTVNTASRIERLTRKYGVMIVISDATLSSIERPEEFEIRLLGRVKVKGRSTALKVYHVLSGYSEDVRSLYLATRNQFEEAVSLALGGQYPQAARAFEEILQHNPMDSAAHFYLERMQRAGVAELAG